MAPPKKVRIDKEDLERWLGVGEVQKELGLSKQGIRNLLERGVLRGVKTRIGWLVDDNNVRALAALQREEADRKNKAERDALVARATQSTSSP